MASMSGKETTIFICGGECCLRKRSEEIRGKVIDGIAERGLTGQISVGRMFCFHMCGCGPNILVAPDGTLYSGVTCENVLTVLDPVFVHAGRGGKTRSESEVV